MSDDDLDKLTDELTRFAYEYELEAARAREFIPDAVPVGAEFTFALRAAVAAGAALGFHTAAGLITDARSE